MDKHFISVTDPGSKTISGHKCPCNIWPPSPEVREAEGIVLVLSLSANTLTFTSPLKRDYQMVTFRAFFFPLCTVIVATGLSGFMNSTLPATLKNLLHLYDY